MSRRPFVIFGLFAAFVVALGWLLFVKEGSEGAGRVEVASADREYATLFAENCGACHTLAAAGTTGVVGPNLDELLNPTGAEATDPEQAETTFGGAYGRVLNAVTCGVGGRMPAGILLGEDAQHVSGFVAAYAGQLGEDAGPLVPEAERDTPPAAPCAGRGGANPSPEPQQP